MLVEAAHDVKGKHLSQRLVVISHSRSKAGHEASISIKPWLVRPHILIRARQRVLSRLVIFAAGEKQ